MTCAAGKGLNDELRLSQCVAEPARQPAEIRRRSGVLQMRREEPEPAFEHLRRAGGASARQIGGRDSALRRPAGVQELRVGAVHPAFQDAGGEAAADARRTRGRVRIQAEQAAGQIGSAEGAEQTCWMESAFVELPRARRCRRGTPPRYRWRWPYAARGPITGAVSASASEAATAGLLMCTIDSLCVSSYSSACENVPLARAALVTPTRVAGAEDGAGPGGDSATAAARVERPSGVPAPASDRPMMSSTRSFVA